MKPLQLSWLSRKRWGPAAQRRMVVVPHRPVLVWSLRVAAVLAVATAGLLGYWTGYYQAAGNLAEVTASLGPKDARLAQLEADNALLKQEVANLSLGSDVDRKASESIRLEVIALKDALQKAQTENELYRNIMNPDEDKSEKGPQIASWEVTATDIPQYVNFKLTVKQLAKDASEVKGFAKVALLGKEAGRDKTYQVTELIPDQPGGNDSSLSIRFKYFQTLTGTLALPQGFTPEQVIISLKSQGNQFPALTHTYPWQVN